MSDLGMGRSGAKGETSLFRGVTVALMLAIGLMGFVGMILLGAYAPDLRSGRNGGAHALSNAATGYSALVELARATGRNPAIIRDDHQFDSESLLVLTPESGATNVTKALQGRQAKPTLFVLPKWQTERDPDHKGWVRYSGLKPLYDPVGVLAPGYQFTMRQYRSGGGALETRGLPGGIAFRAPRPWQVITGITRDPKQIDDEEYRKATEMHPLIVDRHGNMVLVQVGPGPFFVLADPDLLNNRGMKDVGQAASALALLDWMNSNPPDAILFDVSLNGFGHSQSPMKLLFEPPFLAMTLAILAALLLAGIAAFGRFGPVRARGRAIAFGKAALVDNSAALIRRAGREAGLGWRYVAVVRERAVAAFGVPARLRDGALDAYLDGYKGADRFTDLAKAAEEAGDRHSLLAAARALHAWQREKTK